MRHGVLFLLNLTPCARYSNGKPALVFCGSKKDTETLAGALAQGKDYARSMGSQASAHYTLISGCLYISGCPLAVPQNINISLAF